MRNVKSLIMCSVLFSAFTVFANDNIKAEEPSAAVENKPAAENKGNTDKAPATPAAKKDDKKKKK